MTEDKIHKVSTGKTAIIVTAIVCGMIVCLAAIGSFVYVNQQNLAQQKELKEKEIQAENEHSAAQRKTDAYSACKLSGSSFCF